MVTLLSGKGVELSLLHAKGTTMVVMSHLYLTLWQLPRLTSGDRAAISSMHDALSTTPGTRAASNVELWLLKREGIVETSAGRATLVMLKAALHLILASHPNMRLPCKQLLAKKWR